MFPCLSEREHRKLKDTIRQERPENVPSVPDFPRKLIQILASPDALRVAGRRESRIRYNSVDVIAGLAY
jgi:hypothetical protein